MKILMKPKKIFFKLLTPIQTQTRLDSCTCTLCRHCKCELGQIQLSLWTSHKENVKRFPAERPGAALASGRCSLPHPGVTFPFLVPPAHALPEASDWTETGAPPPQTEAAWCLTLVGGVGRPSTHIIHVWPNNVLVWFGNTLGMRREKWVTVKQKCLRSFSTTGDLHRSPKEPRKRWTDFTQVVGCYVWVSTKIHKLTNG